MALPLRLHSCSKKSPRTALLSCRERMVSGSYRGICSGASNPHVFTRWIRCARSTKETSSRLTRQTFLTSRLTDQAMDRSDCCSLAGYDKFSTRESFLCTRNFSKTRGGRPTSSFLDVVANCLAQDQIVIGIIEIRLRYYPESLDQRKW